MVTIRRKASDRTSRLSKHWHLFPSFVVLIIQSCFVETSPLLREVVMAPQKKLYLFVTLFLTISLFYLVLLFLFPLSSLAQGANLFQSVWANLLLLVVAFLFIAFGLSELIDLFHRRLPGARWRRAKPG